MLNAIKNFFVIHSHRMNPANLTIYPCKSHGFPQDMLMLRLCGEMFGASLFTGINLSLHNQGRIQPKVGGGQFGGWVPKNIMKSKQTKGGGG